jgi:ADP-ribose pyrophosphatase YjhB (NUDIX family)
MNSPQEIEENHLNMMKRLAEGLPRFMDGRIDYTTSDVAPVINCIIYHKGHILLLKRSEQVGEYRGKWSGVDGFIDTLNPLSYTVLTELREELSLSERDIAAIRIAEPYESIDKKAGKTWIVYAVLVELNERPDIALDWEHSRYKWIEPEEIRRFDFLPGQDRVLKRALALRRIR